jgi:hypothetical protein
MNKKNKTITTIAILLWLTPLHAQIELGIKGGYGYNRYFFLKDVKQSFLPVYNGGLLFQYLNSKKIGVQSSIDYAQQGWLEQSESGGLANFKMDFVRFDLLSLIKFSIKKENGLFIKFGPYVGYSTNSSFSTSGNTDTLGFNYDSLAVNYKKTDYGIKLGLSYKIKIKSNSLQIEMLYTQGLFNIIDRNPSNFIQSINQNLSINLAYTFSIGKHANKEAIIPKKTKKTQAEQ